MRITNKQIITFTIQIFLSVLALPGAFVFMAVFDIHMNSKFISASDGSIGPGFYAYLKIIGIFLLIIWLSPMLFKLLIRNLKKGQVNESE
ncbi:MAG: hypothetical protein NXI20_13680 [bacterium]|nr:hypothetical protein [bacterium]